MHKEIRGDIVEYKFERNFTGEALPTLEGSGGAALLLAGVLMAPTTSGASLIGAVAGGGMIYDALRRSTTLE